MAKCTFNYEPSEYEYIEQDSFGIDRGGYVCNWDDREYRCKEEEENAVCEGVE